MFYNIKTIPLHHVFHGINLRLTMIGCRDDNHSFFLGVGFRFTNFLFCMLFSSIRYSLFEVLGHPGRLSVRMSLMRTSA